MTPFQQQFSILKGVYGNAFTQDLPSGAVIIVLPDFPLPGGWSQNRTEIRFVAPVGFPLAKPDCFWADPNLRLNGGAMPQSSNLTPIPETTEPRLWFSWHTAQWNPNRDNLMTYLRVIEKRLQEIR